MELYSQNLINQQNSVPPLPIDAEICGWQIAGIAVQEQDTICYDAKSADDAVCRVLEYLPADLADRCEDGLTIKGNKLFAEYKKRFLTAGKLLCTEKIPHLPEMLSCTEDHGTACAFHTWQDGLTLTEVSFPRTAAYIRSLGIALCETYIALHRTGLLYGRLTAAHLRIQPDGTFFLNPAPILLTAVKDTFDRTDDMHILTSFLSGLLSGVDSDDKDDADAAILRNVLQYGYQDAVLLQKALICETNTVEKPRTSYSSKKPILRAILCTAFLAASAFAAFRIGRDHLPLHVCQKLGLIRSDVISVWMPMDPALDETQTQAMYQKLTTGFERKYPGFGVNLMIYADESFLDTLNEEQPVVFMNTNAEPVQNLAMDLTMLTDSLEDSYLADMSGFTKMIPLGCSLPVIWYHTDLCDAPESDYSAAEEMPYDSSAVQFVQRFGEADYTEAVFADFLEERENQPILASTRCLIEAEQSALYSGAVQMIPVSVDGSYPLQYEMYCSINDAADWNSERIAMLWIQYLLTEEAQHIMFAEYYSALPMHEYVLQQTIENHDALGFITDIQQEIDTAALQQGGAR